MANAYQTLILSESGLVSYWELDEPSGTTSTDSKGSHTATLGGTTPPTLAQSGIPVGGTSYLFNGAGSSGGTDSYTKTASGFDLGGTGVTVECWVYITTNPGRGQFVAGYSDSGHACYILLGSSRIMTWNLWDSVAGNNVMNGIGALALNSWHHLVGIGTAGGSMELYVDAVVQVVTPIMLAGTIFQNASGHLEASFNIGGGTNITFDSQFKIDEVALYNVALTPTQISAHYAAGLATAVADLPGGIGQGSQVPAAYAF